MHIIQREDWAVYNDEIFKYELPFIQRYDLEVRNAYYTMKKLEIKCLLYSVMNGDKKWLVYSENNNKIMPIIQWENLKARNAYYFVRRFRRK